MEGNTCRYQGRLLAGIAVEGRIGGIGHLGDIGSGDVGVVG